jgi:hypothetical protein
LKYLFLFLLVKNSNWPNTSPLSKTFIDFIYWL